MSKKKSVYRIESHDGYYFNINEDKRTVVAVLEGNSWAAIDHFDRAYYKYRRTYNDDCFPFGAPIVARPSAKTATRYIGIAKCSEEDSDKFDVEFGKKLALARAKEQQAKDIEQKFFKIVNCLDELNYSIGKYYDKLYRDWVSCSSWMYKLLRSVSAVKDFSEADSE